MKVLIIAALLLTSCHPCSTCGTKEEGRKFKKIKREARKMERKMNRQQKNGQM